MRASILNLTKILGPGLVLWITCSVAPAQTGTVEGAVQATNSSVPPGARVVLIDTDNGLTREPDSINAVTGRFEMNNVQEGKYRIVACAGEAYNPTQLNIEVKEGKTRSAGLTLSLARARALVKGRIKIPNIDVSALAFGCEVATTKTDARGRFKFESLPVPPQQYAVRAQATGATALSSNTFQVTPGGETEVDLSLKEADSGNTLLAQVVYEPRCDRKQGAQTDLSGTYTGQVTYTRAGWKNDATLTITGNDFTITSGSETQSGRITAVTTCGYTAATLMFGDLTPPSPNTPPAANPALSLRVIKVGQSVSLTTVPGEKQDFVFRSTAEKRTRTRFLKRSSQ